VVIFRVIVVLVGGIVMSSVVMVVMGVGVVPDDWMGLEDDLSRSEVPSGPQVVRKDWMSEGVVM
jgi:hypothetical protein